MTATIYRPPGYGPAPTRDEVVASDEIGNCAAVWLAMDSTNKLTPGLFFAGHHGDCSPVDDFMAWGPMRHDRWLLLGPDGLPCAIGTPPEAEEIYNADGLHVGTWLARAAAPRTERERRERDLAEAAVAEAYAHARWSACDSDPGEHLRLSYTAHTRDARTAARAPADHIIKEQGP